MKIIEIRGGLTAIIDDDDFDKISIRKWRSEKGYAKSGGAYNSVYMHRIITNAPIGMEVDHINGNPLDNRKCNLRICTGAQNRYNRPAYGGKKKNKSGYKGVWRPKNSKKYVAEIRYNLKKYHLGSFNTPEEAACAYNKKALEFFGEYARLNKID
jgi:hypothetical protein